MSQSGWIEPRIDTNGHQFNKAQTGDANSANWRYFAEFA